MLNSVTVQKLKKWTDSKVISSRKEKRTIKNRNIKHIIILFTRVQILCYISKRKIYVQNGKKKHKQLGRITKEQLNVDSSGTL
jgi:hypothetical protein